jgi:arsenate reductase
MITLYGIPQCDSVKKAQAWLNKHDLSFHFHDVRTTPLPHSLLLQWMQRIDKDTLINRRSTSWRQIPTVEQDATSENDIAKLLLRYPTVMKRPVLEANNKIMVGFDLLLYEKNLL